MERLKTAMQKHGDPQQNESEQIILVKETLALGADKERKGNQGTDNRGNVDVYGDSCQHGELFSLVGSFLPSIL
jgi:hypothetical protein